MSGQVETVCGRIDAEKIGFTLTHEHLVHEAKPEMFVPLVPLAGDLKKLASDKIDPKNKWLVDFHPYSCRDNIHMNGDEIRNLLKDEMRFLRQNVGEGATLVEVTTFGKDVEFMRRVSCETGVNIVAGAGFYVADTFPASIRGMTEEKLYENMLTDLYKGVPGSDGIKCGVIGEIASVYPIDPFEKRNLRAAAQIQCENKTTPVIIHPGRHPEAPFEIMRIFQEAGGKPEKTIMSHLERTLLKDEELINFAETKTICEFDLFGIECSYYELADLDMPNDAERINRLKMLIDEGFGEAITISHDLHTKHRLMGFGGHGFSHIPLNVIPKMKRRGFTEQNINDILVNNPRRWLAI